jgi:hypothetical protein
LSEYVLAGLILAGVIIAGLFGLSLRPNWKPPTLTTAVVVILAAGGVPGGIKVAETSLTAKDDELKPFTDEERTYIFLGGVALVWVSLDTLWTTCRGRRPPPPKLDKTRKA